MEFYNKKHKSPANSRGGVLVLVAILLIVFIGVAALAIDIGYISTTKNELQNVADAAALAATGKLGQIYFDNAVYNHSDDYDDIRNVISIDYNSAALTNRASHKDIKIEEADIEVGKWDWVTHNFDASETTFPNAVRVTARRDTVTNGQISALFAGVFGIDAFDVSVNAVAALSGQGKLEPGESKLPIGVSERWFLDTDGDGEPDGCREEIHLNDTGTACAGWHSYTETVTSTTNLNKQIFGTVLDFKKDLEIEDLGTIRDLIAADQTWLEENYLALLTSEKNEGLAWLLARYQTSNSALNYFSNTNNPNSPDPFLTPGAEAYVDSFEFMGGVSAGMFDDPDGSLQALFDFFKVRDEIGEEPLLDEFGVVIDEDDIWRTTVPVYKDNESYCENPSQTTLIVGAADIIVRGINPSPANDVDIEIECSYKKLRGSGGSGGVIGIIPNLVK